MNGSRANTANTSLGAVIDLLAMESDCRHIADVLDEAAYSYATNAIANSRDVVPGDYENDVIYWLRALRDAVWKASQR